MPAKSQKKTVPSGDHTDEDDRSMMDIIKNMSSQLSSLTSKMEKIRR
jgi:hypothetical protein